MDQGTAQLKIELLYKMLDRYRAGLKTSALTIHDVWTFINKHHAYHFKPESVLEIIVLGNACSWASYDMSCNHYETYRESLEALIDGIREKVNDMG